MVPKNDATYHAGWACVWITLGFWEPAAARPYFGSENGMELLHFMDPVE